MGTGVDVGVGVAVGADVGLGVAVGAICSNTAYIERFSLTVKMHVGSVENIFTEVPDEDQPTNL